MVAEQLWQLHWAAEGKVCSGDAGHLNPPPYMEIGKGEEHLAAPNQCSNGGENPPLCTRGIFDSWRGGGAPCSVLPAAQLKCQAFFAQRKSAAAALCRPHSDSFWLKRLPRGHQKMAAVQRWQQCWAVEGKVCSGDAGHINPPPYAEIGKGEEHLAAPNQCSKGGDNPPLCARGIFDPWRGGGAPRSALPVTQLQHRAFFARRRSAAAALCCPHSNLFLLLLHRVVWSNINNYYQ
jgi:hypothetical protein